MPSVLARAAVAATVILSLGASACGTDDRPGVTASTDAAIQECRDQWRDVAANLVGLDEDPNPSAMAKRWANVLATVSIYEETPTADGCQQNIETISTGITELRTFTARLQPYDMEYQAAQVADGVTAYLAAPLPAPTGTGKNRVKPPTKQAVTAALATLTAQAAAANAELAPPWAQLESVTLTETATVTSAVKDLDDFAKESTSWLACRQALRVIRTALAAAAG